MSGVNDAVKQKEHSTIEFVSMDLYELLLEDIKELKRALVRVEGKLTLINVGRPSKTPPKLQVPAKLKAAICKKITKKKTKRTAK